MSYVGKVYSNGANHLVASTLYGVCSTGASTASKIVTLSDFDGLLTGVTIQVKFQYSNTANSPTLNVNGTGAYPIYTDGVNYAGKTNLSSWKENSVVSLTFDGTAWRMNDVGAPVSNLSSQLLNLIYPVGAIYMSVNNTNPGTLFGGSWEQIKDKFLLSAGTTYGAGTSGGTASTTLSTANLPSHNHSVGAHAHGLSSIKTWVNNHVHSYLKAAWTGATALTVDQIPAHTHGSKTLVDNIRFGKSSSNSNYGVCDAGQVHIKTTTETDSWTRGIQLATINNNPTRYEVDFSHEHNSVGGGGSHSHSISADVDNTGKSTAWSGSSTDNSSSFNTGNTGSGTSFSNLPPYLAVYVWKRVS